MRPEHITCSCDTVTRRVAASDVTRTGLTMYRVRAACALLYACVRLTGVVLRTIYSLKDDETEGRD